MKAAVNWLGSLLVAVSIGTFISLVILLAMLWWKGALADERILGMLAALHGVQAEPPDTTGKPLDPDAEQPSVQQLLAARLQASLDLDLRESAIDKALGDLRTLETAIRTERNRLDDWKLDFDKRLANLETAATDTALFEIQQTLQTIAPKQAKDQIMKMLEEPVTETDNPMQDIVTVMKAMPLDKRKKLIAEFKTPEEIEKLAAILHNIRVGTPDVELLRDTRGQLQQSSPMP